MLLDALLLRRSRLALSGSPGCKPLALAKRFRISVKLTSPTRWPETLALGREVLETDACVPRGACIGIPCEADGSEVGREGKWGIAGGGVGADATAGEGEGFKAGEGGDCMEECEEWDDVGARVAG